MTVDLSKAVKGSKVYFRCGGEAVVTENNRVGHLGPCNGLTFVGDDNLHWYNNAGYEICEDQPSVLDIVRIEPPEFDWSTVKPGMAFTHPEKPNWGIAIYVGRHPQYQESRVFHYTGGTRPLDYDCDQSYVRAPEHDIEVAQ